MDSLDSDGQPATDQTVFHSDVSFFNLSLWNCSFDSAVLVDNGVKLVGIDICKRMVEFCKRRRQFLIEKGGEKFQNWGELYLPVCHNKFLHQHEILHQPFAVWWWHKISNAKKVLLLFPCTFSFYMVSMLSPSIKKIVLPLLKIYLKKKLWYEQHKYFMAFLIHFLVIIIIKWWCVSKKLWKEEWLMLCDVLLW